MNVRTPKDKQLSARLHTFRLRHDLTWPAFTSRVNDFLVGCGRSAISQTTLYKAARGGTLHERIAVKLQTFLEAKGF